MNAADFVSQIQFRLGSNGKIIFNVSVVVLQGSEDWKKNTREGQEREREDLEGEKKGRRGSLLGRRGTLWMIDETGLLGAFAKQ